jgi:hypothetical protein
MLAKQDSIVLVRVPPHHHDLGRRIPVEQEIDRTVTAAEVKLRVCPGRRADPFINPVLGVALGTGDIHAALSEWSLGRCLRGTVSVQRSVEEERRSPTLKIS